MTIQQSGPYDGSRPLTLPLRRPAEEQATAPVPVQQEVLVLPPNHSQAPVMLYDYSKVKHLGGYDVKGNAIKAQNALKAMNIPDQGQHYANGHLVYNKRYASYV